MGYDFRRSSASAALWMYKDGDGTVFFMPGKHHPVRNPITGLTLRGIKPVKVPLSQVSSYLTSDAPAAAPEVDLKQLVLETALRLGGGPRRRVRIADIHKALPDIDLKSLHRTLFDLQTANKLVIYRIDDPTDITPADSAAAMSVGGFPRHIVWVE